MSKKNINVKDKINAILDKEQRPFIAVSRLLEKLGNEARKEILIKKSDTVSTAIQKLKNFSEDEFMFLKKGKSNYIVRPCMPEDLILNELSYTEGKSPKVIVKLMPFLKSDCIKIINELLDNGRIKIRLSDNFETKIYLVSNAKSKAKEKQYTVEEFRKAFDANDNGRIFVRICDIRNTLKWPREIFDNMLKKLRDEELIQLHAAESEFMTAEEINDSFVDENNFRMGTVTRNDR